MSVFPLRKELILRKKNLFKKYHSSQGTYNSSKTKALISELFHNTDEFNAQNWDHDWLTDRVGKFKIIGKYSERKFVCSNATDCVVIAALFHPKIITAIRKKNSNQGVSLLL